MTAFPEVDGTATVSVSMDRDRTLTAVQAPPVAGVWGTVWR